MERTIASSKITIKYGLKEFWRINTVRNQDSQSHDHRKRTVQDRRVALLCYTKNGYKHLTLTVHRSTDVEMMTHL